MARTVVIVDDSARFRTAARNLLGRRGYDVVGEAPDGRSALAAVERLRPQLLLLDVQLPDIDGFEVARRLAGSAEVEVVLISARDQRAYRDRLAGSGARGFIRKEELSVERLDELLDAVR